MGRTVTPTYALKYSEVNSRGMVEIHTVGWRKEYGRANHQNCVKYLRAFEQSTLTGGCNEQIGPRKVVTFALVRQKDGVTVVSGVMPQTEV